MTIEEDMGSRPQEAVPTELVALLPCPFCGVPPQRHSSGNGTGTMIECNTPDCVAPHVSYYGDGAAEARWNRRATTPSRSGLDDASGFASVTVKRAPGGRVDEAPQSLEQIVGELAAFLAQPAYGTEDAAEAIATAHRRLTSTALVEIGSLGTPEGVNKKDQPA